MRRIQGAMQHAQDQNDQNADADAYDRRRCGAKSKAHHGCHHVTRFKNKINQAKEAFTSVIQLANQTTCQSVSTKAFGYGLKQSKDTYNTVSQQAMQLGLHAMTIDNTNQTQSYILKGLTSHCKAVRNALHRFLNDTNYICHSEIGDEASMWCRRALTAKEKEIAKKAAAKQKAAGKKGACNIDRMVTKKIRVPCLNSVQHVRLSLESSNKSITFQLHSPTQAIGKGNWGTMMQAKRKWSFLCCGQVGEKLDSVDSEGKTMQEAVDNIKHIGKCMTHDDAGTNECILAREQAALKDKRGPGRIRMLTHTKCQSHQACLLNRTVYGGDDHAAILARLSHLMQNNRTLSGVLEKADIYLETIFEFNVVDRFPNEMTGWNNSARRLLKSSSKLSDEEVRLIR